MSLLKVENLFMSYKNNHVLDGAYLHLGKSEITSVVGRNGCGKSTLLKAVAGLLCGSRESLFLDERYIGKKDRMKYMAYLPQQSFLPKNVKVKRLLKLFLSDEQRRSLINDKRINGLLEQKAVTLSGGEMRYLEFFMIASLEKKAYFFDEPFSGIEPVYIKNIKRKLLDLKSQGRYILITDHDYHSVRDVSDCIWLSRAGRFEVAVDPDRFLADSGYLPALQRRENDS